MPFFINNLFSFWVSAVHRGPHGAPPPRGWSPPSSFAHTLSNDYPEQTGEGPGHGPADRSTTDAQRYLDPASVTRRRGRLAPVILLALAAALLAGAVLLVVIGAWSPVAMADSTNADFMAFVLGAVGFVLVWVARQLLRR